MGNVFQTMMVGSFFGSIFVLVFGFMGAFVFLTTVGYYQEYKDRKLAKKASIKDSIEEPKTAN